MDEGLHHIKINKTKNGTSTEREDVVAVEAPLAIQIKLFAEDKPRAISVTMRTPGGDEELTLGFLFTEGLISGYEQIKAVKYLGENIVKVYLNEGVTINLQKAERNFYTTSSCGVCGKASIEAITTKAPFEIKNTTIIKDETLYSLKAKLAEQQSLFTATGGIHAAALFSEGGKLLTLQEDVGRHNALDKLVGEAFRKNQLPLEKSILLLSGRASFELIQKATMAGIGTIVSVGAPSSLAVELARENGQTLIGFLKEGSYNLYT
ncbi:formate dehydrogenase accessory sulfurtransferase FdhD [Bacteroidia bacterium]|nr:formate dehydrogenase accessory sulfurtransferase FdhD [Bacteroidia bacterium]MDB4106899.1 formate dehydrogenase accessory sulfurtransferase FdhD [Bacteroidia bacterium]MDB9882713.1 formate dehydrogenase accessory sulfurtransferase FdhD [Bacteroidia bacterium]